MGGFPCLTHTKRTSEAHHIGGEQSEHPPMYFASLDHLRYVLAHFVAPGQPLVLTVDGVRYAGFDLAQQGGAVVLTDLRETADLPVLAGELAELLRGGFGHLPGATRVQFQRPDRNASPLMEDLFPVIEARGSERAYPVRLRCA